MDEKKKDKEHKHFANDDPTEFKEKTTEEMAKEALKRYKSLQG